MEAGPYYGPDVCSSKCCCSGRRLVRSAGTRLAEAGRMSQNTRDRDRLPQTPETAEETFKREGPEPPAGDTGDTVEEMNDAARDAVLRNIRPERTDD
jgi:hypothetical protein